MVLFCIFFIFLRKPIKEEEQESPNEEENKGKEIKTEKGNTKANYKTMREQGRDKLIKETEAIQ